MSNTSDVSFKILRIRKFLEASEKGTHTINELEKSTKSPSKYIPKIFLQMIRIMGLV